MASKIRTKGTPSTRCKVSQVTALTKTNETITVYYWPAIDKDDADLVFSMKMATPASIRARTQKTVVGHDDSWFESIAPEESLGEGPSGTTYIYNYRM